MDKNSVKKSIEVIKFVNSISKYYCFISLLKGFIGALLQAITIFFSGLILDWLASDMGARKTIIYSLLYVSLIFVLSIINLVFDKFIAVKKRYIEDYTKIKVAEKGMQMDYAFLEKQQTMQLLDRASRGVYANGGIAELLEDYGNIIQELFQIVYSCIGLVGLFCIAPNLKGRWLVKVVNSPLFTSLS